MKKIIAALLCALLAFSSVAMAETVNLMDSTDRFDITLALPEGATLSQNELNGSYTLAEVKKDGLADIIIAIAPSEEYAERSMTDLTEEEINGLVESTSSDYDQPDTKIDVTPSGNKYILVNQSGEDGVAMLITIYRGYFVQLLQLNDDDTTLTEADIDFMMNVLYGIEFVEVAK